MPWWGPSFKEGDQVRVLTEKMNAAFVRTLGGETRGQVTGTDPLTVRLRNGSAQFFQACHLEHVPELELLAEEAPAWQAEKGADER